MVWWNELIRLKRRLKDVQNELEQEQGKSTRLAGFLARLQGFGVSPTGEVPRRAFAEALMDTVHILLKVEQAALFQFNHEAMDYTPIAAIGFPPQVLARLRIQPGEGVLGRAAQEAKATFETRQTAPPSKGAEEFLTAPYAIVPILSQGRSEGLLFVAKPISGALSAEDRSLLTLLAAQAALVLEDHAQHELFLRTREQAVTALARALEAKDAITHRHSYRTHKLVRPLTQDMALPDILIEQIELGALLHDIGKIGIDDAILQKTSELTPEEYNVMKTHATLGRKILEPLPALRSAAAMVLYHQEWYNGAGYPDGLAGEEIPLGARVVQIIDAWDAMTSDRPYRKAMSKASAIAELRRMAGSQFDPKLVELFLRVIDRLEREGVATTDVSGAVTASTPRA